MSFNTQEQEIIKYGLQNGKSSQEIQTAISNSRLGIVPVKKVAVQPVAQEPSLLSKIGTDYNQRADRVNEILKMPVANPLKNPLQSLSEFGQKETALFGQGAGGVANAIEQTAMAIPGVKQIAGGIGEGMKWLSSTPLVQGLGDKLGESKKLQEITNLYDTDQSFKDTVDGVANLARLGVDVQTVVDSAGFAKNVTNKLVDRVKSIELPTLTPPPGGTVNNIIDKTKTALSRSNVPENFETSVQRLSKPNPNIPLKEVKSPLTKYNEYLAQEQKFKLDGKADTALSKVGEDIGTNFEKVIKTRRQAGETMGSELEKVGGIKTDISNSFPTLETELQKNGLIFSGGKIKTTGAVKMSSQDVRMIENYVKELNKLGANPTVKELDAFLSRVPSELDVYKATNNVTKVTNGERIIKGHLSEARKALTENSNPALSAYAQARATYADLTNFLDEGSKFLGKKTQAGDYAKDASIAKSSVQSIINNGKKDWLLRLEDLTNYPAIDNSIIALQAMKDAGNFRGLSLLETLSGGKIPLSKASAIDKAINYGIEKGGKAFVGTPAEQTRRIIQQSMSATNPPAVLPAVQNLTKSNSKTRISNPISPTIPQIGLKSNVSDVAKAVKKKVKETHNKQGGFVKNPLSPISDLASEAKKYKTAEDFVKKQPVLYHGSGTELKQFNNKQGTFFTDDMMNAEGYAGGDGSVYEGYLNFKNPLIIDAKGKLYNDLKTEYGKSTTEIVGKVDKQKYDGVIFKNIKDNWIDDADVQDPSTIYYAFKPKDSFLNEFQLTEIWKKSQRKANNK
jgi:hypothetical protein